MKSVSLGDRLKGVFPVVTTLLLLFFPVAFVPAELQGITPPLFMLALFFWLTFSPGHISLWFVFLCGLLADTLTAMPLGVLTLATLILSAIVYKERRYLHKLAFLNLWLRFGMIISGLAVVTHLGLCLYHQAWLDWNPAAVQLLLSILLYPAVHWCLYMVFSTMPNHHV